MDGKLMRETILNVVSEYSSQGPSFNQKSVLQEVARRLSISPVSKTNIDSQQAILTFWYDLFRIGYLAWGLDVNNPDPPFCHLTEQGRKALAHLSRDPANPEGYLKYLRDGATISPIADSYIKEALHTFNTTCFKASAVMIGVASEDLILSVRDELVARMDAQGHARPSELADWKVKKILGAIEQILDPKKKQMPKPLAESFEIYWPSFTGQIRTIRNEVGHPNDIDPVEEETVHAALLIFPMLAKLSSELIGWLRTSYS